MTACPSNAVQPMLPGRGRKILLLAGAPLLLLGALAVSALLLVQMVVATECAALPREDLSLREMAQPTSLANVSGTVRPSHSAERPDAPR